MDVNSPKGENVQRSTPNIECLMQKVVSEFDIRRSALDVRCFFCFFSA